MKKNITLLSTLLLLSFTSCNSQTINKPPTQKSKKETTTPMFNPEKQIEDLRTSMLDYMRSAGPSYTEKDVNACIDILKRYVADMEKSNSKEEGMQIVKAAVLQLNDLNEGLIETGEREQIAEIIIAAGHQKGYNGPDEDITEDWREW